MAKMIRTVRIGASAQGMGAVECRIEADTDHAGHPVGVHRGLLLRRPHGSRNKSAERFVADLFGDWQRHGTNVIEQVRQTDPVNYLCIVAGLVRHAREPEQENLLENLAEDELRTELIAEFENLFPEFRIVPAKRPTLITGPKKGDGAE